MRPMFILATLCACTPDPEISPFAGPEGTESIDTEAAEVFVGMTHLQVKNAPGPGGQFGDHAGAIADWMYSDDPPAGWLGASFRNVGQLHWWTYTVWETEQDLLNFVISDVHRAAMSDFAEVAVRGETDGMPMARDEALPDWEAIVAHLESLE